MYPLNMCVYFLSSYRDEEEVGMDILDEVGVNLQVGGSHVPV